MDGSPPDPLQSGAMVPGKATPEGTAAFARRFPALDPGHWRPALGLTLSSVGLGTYLGNADPVTDQKYAASARRALGRGVNVLDSAINYRYERSERSLGAALREAVASGAVAREEVLVCTKGGFITGDHGPATREWFEAEIVRPGLARLEDVAAGGHCMTPGFLRHELERSRRNLGVETIDVYYVHNPETQIPEVGEDEYYRRLTAAFAALEEAAREGKIQFYGTATWTAYRVPPGDASHASLERTLECARAAGGVDHRFRVIQLPLSLALPEAYATPTQAVGGRELPALEVAAALGLAAFTSAPLVQGRLLGHPALREARDRFPGLRTDAQRCLQFARSVPGVAVALCGMKTVDHVEENLQIARVPPMAPEALETLFEGGA
jgi:aryl-alcohol dehydrogenase-like predicted oxidoreductase